MVNFKWELSAMKNFLIYIKSELLYLVLLLLAFVVPLGLFFQFSSYPLPKVQYVVLGVLLVSQYFFSSEKSYRRRVESKASLQMRREIGKTPSIKMINSRVNQLIVFRGISVSIAAFAILSIMVIYRQF